MHEEFQQIMMQAFYQHVKAIYINGNGAVMFETGKRFKCKKIEIISQYTKQEIIQLISYIKHVSNIKTYTINPSLYFLSIGAHYLQVQICCIPSMYFECVVLRIVKSRTFKMKKQYMKNKYIL